MSQKFHNKRYRDAFVASRVRNWIAYQIRAIREQRDWSQKEFEKKMGKPQSVISRLENPSYGKVTVQTLLDVASAFNVALIVKFVDFPTFLRQTADVSSRAMEVAEYGNESVASASSDITFITSGSLVVIEGKVQDESYYKVTGQSVDRPHFAFDARIGAPNTEREDLRVSH